MELTTYPQHQLFQSYDQKKEKSANSIFDVKENGNEQAPKLPLLVKTTSSKSIFSTTYVLTKKKLKKIMPRCKMPSKRVGIAGGFLVFIALFLVNLLNEKPIMPPPFPSYGISTESDKLEDDMRKLKWQDCPSGPAIITLYRCTCNGKDEVPCKKDQYCWNDGSCAVTKEF